MQRRTLQRILNRFGLIRKDGERLAKPSQLTKLRRVWGLLVCHVLLLRMRLIRVLWCRFFKVLSRRHLGCIAFIRQTGFCPVKFAGSLIFSLQNMALGNLGAFRKANVIPGWSLMHPKPGALQIDGLRSATDRFHPT
jgi:hypothetical protein